MALLPGTLTIPDRREHARHRLLMFHHACGSATNYYKWATGFPAHIEVWLVELPGRGRNLNRPAIDALPQLRDYLRELAPELPSDYAIFGHSMGALVAYCFAHDMTQLGRPPRWLGVSGADSPFAASRRRAFPVHQRADAAIVDYLASLGGTPPEVFAHDELRTMLLTLAKADFRIVEAFFPLASPTPLPVPVTVFAGRQDAVLSPEGLSDWQRASTRPIELRAFDGGHFYLLDDLSAVHDAVDAALAQHERPRGGNAERPLANGATDNDVFDGAPCVR
ncbi:thioesterase [Burkholderia sp. ABCPW 14]|uniref:thioesterase II family protein n=1 Tax=Burkholderia sp. ABCPW 14 TaxID=1637860 RepID=UPI000770D1FE|nr:alpha/beta fold hydrolase [Burkholderia sp. ABCPW 14]KVD88966.1 thioesterase [Burkholderia sp. ABCPW 14]